MKKITLLILAAMFCIGTLTLLGCSDEPEVMELEPVEEVLEEANIEEEVVELEPEPEPLYFGEEIEPAVSEEELNVLITAAANRMATEEWLFPTLQPQRYLEALLDYANARPLAYLSHYDHRAALIWPSIVSFDLKKNDLQIMKAMRDSRTNSVLRDKYDDLIEAMTTIANNGDIQVYIDALKAIDAGLHPEAVGERQILPFFDSILAPFLWTWEEDALTEITINDEQMTLGAAWATNQLPIQRKYRDIRRKIDAGEDVSFKLMPPKLVQI